MSTERLISAQPAVCAYRDSIPLPVQGTCLGEAALNSRKIPAGPLDKADPEHGTMTT